MNDMTPESNQSATGQDRQEMSDLISTLTPEQQALLALRLQQKASQQSSAESQELPLRPAGRQDALPLSFAQQRLWFLSQLEPGNPFYNTHLAVHFQGTLDVAALRQSLNDVVQRHEVLRTTFTAGMEEPRQIIAPELTLPLLVADLQGIPATERIAAGRKLAAQVARRPFDLARGPLLHAIILRLEADEHVALLAIHHIISDGWSSGLLIRELGAFYTARTTGQPATLPALPIQYADFAVWQRQWLQGEVLEAQLAYWQQQLADLPILDLPADRPRPPMQTFQGARHAFMLPSRLCTDLRALGHREDATLFMVLLTAFAILLHRYAGQDDIVVGTPIANRTQPELDMLIGFFVNTLVLRTHVSNRLSVRELLKHVRETTLDAYAHQDLPFARLVEALQPERDLSRNPLFQVDLVLHNEPTRAALQLPDLTVEPLDVETQVTQFDISLRFQPVEDELRVVIVYSTALFDAATIQRLGLHLHNILDGIVAAPTQCIAGLSLLSEAERHQVLAEWNPTHAVTPSARGIQELIAAQAARTPDAVAVTCDGISLTYQCLNRKANQLARHLQQLGVGPEVPVGIYMARSAGMLVGLLGVLKAGGAYVPLDPTYPTERLAFMLSHAHVPVLLSQQHLASDLPAHPAEVVYLDSDWPQIAQSSDAPVVNTATAANAAYIIYTSGSTGEPKGVAVTHESLCHYVQVLPETLGIRSDDIYLHTASLAFSSSVRQFMVPLCQGAAVVVATDEQRTDPLALLEVIRQHGVTVIDLVPSHWRACTAALSSLTAGARAALLDNRLRLILSASEALMADIPQTWRHDFKHGAALVNMFGQTETTGIVSVYPIPGDLDKPRQIVPIGRPIRHAQIYLLDLQLQPVPIGVSGDVYLGGTGLARGYLNRPALTAQAFVPHPYHEVSGARLYRTGDQARYRLDGTLEFLGRIDQQVKVRGFRIELEEIEATLRRHPSVREAAATVWEDGANGKRLVAYLVPHPEQEDIVDGLRVFMQRHVPAYMVPSTFVLLDALPVLPNGKVDRRALPAGEGDLLTPEQRFVAPRTPVEVELVQIWGDILSRTQVGIHDDFFALGGHSILATMLMIRIQETFQVSLPLRSLFMAPTVAELAIVILDKQSEQIESDDLEALLAELEDA